MSQFGLSVLMKVKLRTTEKTSAHAHRTALQQAQHSAYANLDRMACFIQAHAGNTSISIKAKLQDTVAHDRGICSPLRYLPQCVEREYHRSAAGFQVHTAYTTSTSNRNIICSYFSSAMDSLHELFPRIRTTRIRTALNGRLNKRFPVCSRR